MLVSVSVREVLPIDRLELSPKPGVRVLRGGSGAGKSILLDVSSLARGARSENGLIARGAERGFRPRKPPPPPKLGRPDRRRRPVSGVFEPPRDHPAPASPDAQGLEPAAEKPIPGAVP